MRILVINGPNLNMLGTREPEIYGSQTLADLDALCAQEAQVLGIQVSCCQSNHEGEIVTWVQQAKGNFDGLLINAGAYAHTSVALHDALKSVSLPVVEVHLSNPHAREPFRHTSYVAPVAVAVIAGCGTEGYKYGLRTLVNKLRK